MDFISRASFCWLIVATLEKIMKPCQGSLGEDLLWLISNVCHECRNRECGMCDFSSLLSGPVAHHQPELERSGDALWLTSSWDRSEAQCAGTWLTVGSWVRVRLLCSFCQFLWCEYSYCNWFLAANVTSLNAELGWDEHDRPSQDTIWVLIYFFLKTVKPAAFQSSASGGCSRKGTRQELRIPCQPWTIGNLHPF